MAYEQTRESDGENEGDAAICGVPAVTWWRKLTVAGDQGLESAPWPRQETQAETVTGSDSLRDRVNTEELDHSVKYKCDSLAFASKGHTPTAQGLAHITPLHPKLSHHGSLCIHGGHIWVPAWLGGFSVCHNTKCTQLRCTTQCFHLQTHSELIARVKLINTSFSSHSYVCTCVVRTLQIQSLGKLQVQNTVQWAVSPHAVH